MATSPGPRASRPSSMVRPSKPSWPNHEIPNAGPEVLRGLPLGLTMVDSRMMFISTELTPGTAAMPETSAAGTVSRSALASSPKAMGVRTSRAMSPRSSSKRLLMAVFTLSVSMKAPETNATPLTMANTVRIMRNLRASTPRKVRRMTGEDTVMTRVSSCGRALAHLLVR